MKSEIGKKVTLQDIADEAEVAITTVHRALSGKGDISSYTSKKIKAIASQLGYGDLKQEKPSSLDFHIGHTVGLLLFNLPVFLIKHRLNMQLMSYLVECLGRHGILMSVHQVTDADQLPSTVRADRLAGVIIMGSPTNPQIIKDMMGGNAVGVFIQSDACSVWDWVAPDYEVRGRMAADYLIDRGHRRIGYLSHVPDHYGFRIAGSALVRRARDKSIQADEYITSANDSKGMPREDIIDGIVEDILSLPSDKKPTGLHVSNDLAVRSVYTALQRRGVSPMKDIDIISCDNDDDVLNNLDPRPATFDLNLEIIAEKLVENLLNCIRRPNRLGVGARIFVPPRIVQAES